MNVSYIWPIGLVVLSNTVYQICAKSSPSEMHPLASLTVTYLVGALTSGVLYFALNRDRNLMREYAHLNWAPFVLGFVIVGLEVGFLCKKIHVPAEIIRCTWILVSVVFTAPWKESPSAGGAAGCRKVRSGC